MRLAGFAPMAVFAEKLMDPAWAWAPYQPSAEQPWNLARVAHLFRRADWGADWPTLQQALSAGPQLTLAGLFQGGANIAQFNRQFDKYERPPGEATGAEALRAWWLRRMLETPHPLLEKTTLFWHSHFGASNLHVNNAGLMAKHVQLLRRHALGSFADLLTAVFSSPAVFVCTEAKANRKSHPPESLARALLENYSVGPGQFSGRDLHEAARCFTGWFVLRNQLQFIQREQDSASRIIFGQAGNWALADLLKIALQQKKTAEQITRKLYRWFISETSEPAAALVQPLAARFRQDYDISKLVQVMLSSNLFFSAAAMHQKVKSPVEFALGIAKALQGHVATRQLGTDLAELGQDLYEPPTVKGWAGGRYWINRYTVAGRRRLACSLLAAAGPYRGNIDLLAVARRHGHDGAGSAARFFTELLFPGENSMDESVRKLIAGLSPTATTPDKNIDPLRELVTALASRPEFQLA